MDYEKYTIREISLEIKTGKTPPTSQDIYYKNGDIEWFTPGDFSTNNSILNIANKKISSIAIKTSNAPLYRPQTVLITCIGDIGKVGITQKEVSANQQITGIYVNEKKILPKFFYYWLRRNQNLLKYYSNYAIIPILNNSILSNIPIFVPNLNEQNKIVSQLESLQLLIEKRKKTIDLLDKIIRAKFLEMFGDPVTNSKNWTTKKLDRVILSINAGKSITGINRPKEGEEIGVLKVSAVTYGDFKPEKNKAVINSKIDTSELIFPKKGDLLFSRANTKEFVGATSIVDNDYSDIFLPDKIWKLTINLNKISPIYIHSIFSNKNWRMYFTKESTGSGGSLFNISQETFKNIEIPVPDLKFQNEYEIFYYKLKNTKSKFLLSLQSLEALFQSIQQKVFRGEDVFSEEEVFNELLKTFEVKDFLDKKKRINYLVKSLKNNTLEDLNIYEKAKTISFELLNREEINQEYDSIQKELLLKNSK